MTSVGGLKPFDQRRILFIPFSQGEAAKGDTYTTSLDWRDTIRLYKSRAVSVVRYEPGQVASAFAELQGGVDANIYIRGHGEPGSQELATYQRVSDEIKKTKLHIHEVADRLIESGLLTSGRGLGITFKFYNCWSGVESNGQEPLAQVGASYLRLKGFIYASFQGYLGKVSSSYVEKARWTGPVATQPVEDELLSEPEVPDGWRFPHRILGEYDKTTRTYEGTRAKLMRKEF